MPSCSPKTEVKYEKNTFYISSEGVSLDDIRELKWRVGPYRKQVVSRGLRLSFELPLIDKGPLEELYEKKRVDSWLIKLRRRQEGHNSIMGYFSLMLVSPDPRRQGTLRFQSPKRSSIGVNYAASSISTRLSALPCPALGHRYRLEDFGVEKRVSPNQVWVVSGAENTYVSSKVEPISYSPITLNGGMELRGEYFIDLALYNSREKRRLSSFIPLDNVIVISRELEVAVKGCENYIIPDRRDDDVIKKFKFKR